jgi:hypothetical protein
LKRKISAALPSYMNAHCPVASTDVVPYQLLNCT